MLLRGPVNILRRDHKQKDCGGFFPSLSLHISCPSPAFPNLARTMETLHSIDVNKLKSTFKNNDKKGKKRDKK